MTPLLLAAAAQAAPEPDISRALALVDWLGWAASDRAVAQYVAEAHEPRGPFGVSLREPDRDRLREDEAAPLYAVEGTLDEVHLHGTTFVLAQLREAVVYTNPASVPLHGLALRVFPNGQDLRHHGAEIEGVWVDDRPAPFEIDGTILSVDLDPPLAPGKTARILLHLMEQVPPFDPRQPLTEAIDPEATGTFGRADGWLNLGYWLPVVTPVDKRGRFDIRPLKPNAEHAMFDPALFHVVLNTPASLAVATTGVETSRVVDGERATTIAVAGWARDFAVALVPDGRVLTGKVGSTRIRVVHAGGSDQGAHLLEYAERAVRVYTERFGPLAEAELDVVEAPLRQLGAVSYPGLVAVDTSHQGVPYHRSAAHEWALAHEIAHQWWGDEVGNDPATTPWLDEGLAAHAASVYWLERYGQDALDMRNTLGITGRLRKIQAQGRADLPANRPAWEYDLDQYAAVVYGRSALFFDQVHRLLGDQRFYGALGRYHDRFAGRFATPDDLLAELAAATDRDGAAQLAVLYTRWITEAHAFEDLVEEPAADDAPQADADDAAPRAARHPRAP
ncbi:MAG: M1 family aminopeptidase [Myxococcota bacterium]